MKRDIVDIMTFCNCNVIVTMRICMFIARALYDIYCMTVAWTMTILYD